MHNQQRIRLAAACFLGVFLGGAAVADDPVPIRTISDDTGIVTVEKASENAVCCSQHQIMGCGCLARNEIRGLPLRVPSFGSTLRCHLNTQIVNGLTAQMIFREYDFDQQLFGDRSQLNVAGKRQLQRVAQLVSMFPGNVIIEPSKDAKLDQARREAILKGLEAVGASFDAEQIVIRDPSTEHLSGVEAELIQGRLLQQTRQGGAQITPQGGRSGASSARGSQSGGFGSNFGISSGVSSGR